MKDQEFECVQCNEPFVFTIDEQQKYADMGFDPPKRCPACRKKRTKLSVDQNHHREAGQRRRSKPLRTRTRQKEMVSRDYQ